MVRVIRDPRTKAVCVDFDGVVRSGRWTQGLEGQPTPGCEGALRRLRARHKLVCLTANSPQLARQWLRAHGLEALFDDVTNVKPPAVAYIDDRAVPFHGDWDAVLRATQELAR